MESEFKLEIQQRTSLKKKVGQKNEFLDSVKTLITKQLEGLSSSEGILSGDES